MCEKLWMIPFWLMRWKWWGVLFCGQLWFSYSKINFEGLYLTQFSIFFWKNWIVGFRVFIRMLQPLGLAFSHIEIQNYPQFSIFESFSTSFYLPYFFPIYCTIPNDLKIFKHVANLLWRMNPKKHHQYGHFLMQMWPCKVQLPCFSQSQKGRFLSIQMLINILQLKWWKFLNFFHMFSSLHTTRSYNYICSKFF